MDEQEIRERIERLKARRDQLVTQANLQIANISGAIEALEELLTPEGESEGE